MSTGVWHSISQFGTSAEAEPAPPRWSVKQSVLRDISASLGARTAFPPGRTPYTLRPSQLGRPVEFHARQLERREHRRQGDLSAARSVRFAISKNGSSVLYEGNHGTDPVAHVRNVGQSTGQKVQVSGVKIRQRIVIGIVHCFDSAEYPV